MRLAGANLRGADLHAAKNLSAEQLSLAIVDQTTKLPDFEAAAR
jgi:uncharacterized protein YjbI with pentapeptide repeats